MYGSGSLGCQMADSTTHPILSMLSTDTTSGPPVVSSVLGVEQ